MTFLTWIVVATAALGLYVALALRHRYLVVRVRGTSMYKTYPDGSRIVVDRKSRPAPRVGEIVALRLPTDFRAGDPFPPPESSHQLFIKRVVGVAGDQWPRDVPQSQGHRSTVPAGHILALGDSTDSLDSRRWGAVPLDRIEGFVTRVMGRPAGRSVL